MESKPRRLRDLIDRTGITVIPGAYDCITAKMVEKVGFEAVYMTGAGSAASRIGMPDLGLITMTEMIGNARNMARAVSLPLIADCDTGYGGILNVMRAVQEYEAAGVAGIHIEDQVFPKKCGHLAGKEVIPKGEFVKKIEAAVQARSNPDFVIIVRTDARAVIGLDEAIDRMKACMAAGADVAFVEAPQSLDEIRRIPAEIDAPCLINMVGKASKTPTVVASELASMGYKLVVWPGATLMTVLRCTEEVLKELRETEAIADSDRVVDFEEFISFMDVQRYEGIERKFAMD